MVDNVLLPIRHLIMNELFPALQAALFKLPSILVSPVNLLLQLKKLVESFTQVCTDLSGAR